MSLQVHALASGSSGNAMLVQGRDGDLLLDCGMPRSFVESALAAIGADPKRLRAIIVTHEHTDHARGALAMARRYRAPIAGSAGTLEAVVADAPVGSYVLTPDRPVEIGEFMVHGYPVAHDAREPMALVVDSGTLRIGYAVDLGQPADELRDALTTASLVILESNHDLGRLLRGPYGPDLKDRIRGGHGHLSNQEAARFISEVSAADRPIHFWLAHLSAVNNSPATALRATRSALRRSGKDHCGVEVALRDHPSLRWSSDRHWWQPRLTLDW